MSRVLRAVAALSGLVALAAGAGSLAFLSTRPRADRRPAPLLRAVSIVSPGGIRDGTDPELLQQRLDQGQSVFLPRLPGGACYRSPGLWVGHSDTTISSNGACLVVTGPGPVRLRSTDGDWIAATAGIFVAHSATTEPPPQDVTVSGLRIRVAGQALDGIDVYADGVTIANVTVAGRPVDDVYIGGRGNVADHSSNVAVRGSTLLDAQRNGISVTAAVSTWIEGNRIGGAGQSLGSNANPGDGIDVEPNSPSSPIQDLHIAGNTISDSVRLGIALTFAGGAPPGAIALSRNTITGSAAGATAPG